MRASMVQIQTPEGKVVRQMEKHSGAAIHWFQNGHPMKTLIAQHDEVVGVDEKTAHRSCKENGTEANDKKRLPFGNGGSRIQLVRTF